jgi:NAD dependent epimerase/dehydratase family enzyme
VLEGQQVKPMRALEAGFNFKYTTIAQAMQAIIRNA